MFVARGQVLCAGRREWVDNKDDAARALQVFLFPYCVGSLEHLSTGVI